MTDRRLDKKTFMVYQFGVPIDVLADLSTGKQGSEEMTRMQQAEDQLRRRILDMDIGPGDQISERWAETQLGVSRTSVRTALFRLEAEGLVIRQGRGWMVSPINLAEIEQLFTYREVLEVAAIRLGAHRLDEISLSKIETTLNARTLNETPEPLATTGDLFHLWIADISQNDFIKKGIREALTRLQRARWLENNPTHSGWGEHLAIIAALRNGQTEQAANLLATHIHETKNRLLAQLKKHRRSLKARGATMTP